MTDINRRSPVGGVGPRPEQQTSFQDRLADKLATILGEPDAAKLKVLISQLPMVLGRSEQDSLDLYANTLRKLLEKQAAFTGTAAVDTAAHWMKSLQNQAVNGQISPQDLINGVNKTLTYQFRTWFEKQLSDKVDNSLPTDFINQFRLGSQSTQEEQIANLDADVLKQATAKIKVFINALSQQMSSSKVRENAISFLRNAFRNLGSVDINELNNSDYLLTKESFKAAVLAQLVKSLNNAGLTLSGSDAQFLANKITWLPGMSKQELRGALNDLMNQVKGQYANAYGSGSVSKVQIVLDAAIVKIRSSSTDITLSSLFSNMAVSLINTQVDAFYNSLHEVQKFQTPQQQVDLIKQHTARDIRFQFEKMMLRKDVGIDFTTRHKKMMSNLAALKARLSKITEDEKKITVGIDGQRKADVKAEHSLTSRDLLSVIDSTIGDRFDERVLFSLNERRVNRLEKRNEKKDELQELTTKLKIFGQVQSSINTKLSERTVTSTDAGHYRPDRVKFTYKDFGYKTQEKFEKGKEFKYLEKNLTPTVGSDGVKYFTHKQFLVKEGVAVDRAVYYNNKDHKYLSNFSGSVSDKSKPINDSVQLKTTALSDISSQYNATVEAMNKFVQKYNNILQAILRAI
ncbi:virulence-associated V antigen [Vibrio cortegadensis]|uniref:Virulence-associated V antigen n=1 Tax=Vibrio cortegadensis TaxID=1328770 RepID=A0ABV4MB57_9VIBR